MRNKEYDKNYSKEYRKNNKIRIAEYSRIYQQEHYTRTRNAVLAILGNKCVKCSFTDQRALQIDHINGGGNKERKLISMGATFYKHVLNDFQNDGNNYQLLCANCNWIKRVENNELGINIDN